MGPSPAFDHGRRHGGVLGSRTEYGDRALIAAALGDIARAKGMSQMARATGLGRESLYKALSPDGNPESPRCSRSCARSASTCTQWPMLNHGYVPGKRDWREDRMYRRGGIGKILGGKVMPVLRRVVRKI